MYKLLTLIITTHNYRYYLILFTNILPETCQTKVPTFARPDAEIHQWVSQPDVETVAYHLYDIISYV